MNKGNKYERGMRNKMYKIVIFDDDFKSCDRTKKVLEKYAGTKKAVFDITPVLSPQALLEVFEKEPDVDVAFLDIRVGEKADGIELAKEINRLAPNTAIVFLTGYIEYATDIYDTKHVYFILKEEFEKRIEALFQKLSVFFERKNQRGRYIVFHLKGKEVVVKEDDISYIERKGRITYIKCKDRVLEVSDKLKDLENKLCPISFARCHNSFIVNFVAVKEFTRTEFLLGDGTFVPVSRYKLEETREKFFVWSKQYL